MALNMQNLAVPVWIVEDNDADFDALQRMLKKERIQNPIMRFANGERALETLRSIRGNGVETNPKGDGEDPEQQARLPGLVFLDLHMNGAHGADVLSAFKTLDPSLPVLMLTGSQNETEIDVCYDRGANGYFLKPSSQVDFQDLVATIKAYWFERAVPPRSLRVVMV